MSCNVVFIVTTTDDCYGHEHEIHAIAMSRNIFVAGIRYLCLCSLCNVRFFMECIHSVNLQSSVYVVHNVCVSLCAVRALFGRWMMIAAATNDNTTPTTSTVTTTTTTERTNVVCASIFSLNSDTKPFGSISKDTRLLMGKTTATTTENTYSHSFQN